MLDSRDIEKKLFELPLFFKEHMKCKRYFEAKACYDKARTVALFIELEEDKKMKLFGERGERGVYIVEGLFKEEQVIKAYEKCIEQNKTYENKKYEPLKNSA